MSRQAVSHGGRGSFLKIKFLYSIDRPAVLLASKESRFPECDSMSIITQPTISQYPMFQFLGKHLPGQAQVRCPPLVQAANTGEGGMDGALWSVELPLIKTASEAHTSRQCTTAEPMTDLSPATFKKMPQEL